jgi:hypothetical protein
LFFARRAPAQPLFLFALFFLPQLRCSRERLFRASVIALLAEQQAESIERSGVMAVESDRMLEGVHGARDVTLILQGDA